jgi:hypothetical protein
MQFDCNEIGDVMSEIAAYGSAVTVESGEAAVPGNIPPQDRRATEGVPEDHGREVRARILDPHEYLTEAGHTTSPRNQP